MKNKKKLFLILISLFVFLFFNIHFISALETNIGFINNSINIINDFFSKINKLIYILNNTFFSFYNSCSQTILGEIKKIQNKLGKLGNLLTGNISQIQIQQNNLLQALQTKPEELETEQTKQPEQAKIKQAKQNQVGSEKLETEPIQTQKKLIQLQEQIDDLIEEIDIYRQRKQVTTTVTETTDKDNQKNLIQSLTSTPTTSITSTASNPVTSSPLVPPTTVLVPTNLDSQPSHGTFLQPIPKLLISEIAIGIDSSSIEFIEIYNPNSVEVKIDSNNFYLKLINSTNKITNKQINWIRNIIPAKSYFLFGSTSTINGLSVDAFFSEQMTDSSGIIIEDKNTYSVLDKVSWGKPEKLPPAEAIETNGIILKQGLKTNQGLERKDLIDTDNNSNDFVLRLLVSPTNSLGQTKILNFENNEKNNKNNNNNNEEDNKKLIISEVQISDTNDENNEFIEIYNPNSENIDLSDWSIQKTSGTSTKVYKKNFTKNSIIPANGYFLIVNSKTTNNYLLYLADMVHNSFTLTEDNTIYLVKNHEKIENANDPDIVDATSTTSTLISLPSPTNSRGEKGPTFVKEIIENITFSPKDNSYVFEDPVTLPSEPLSTHDSISPVSHQDNIVIEQDT